MPKLNENEAYGYVYLTTNLVNGMIYIGQRKGRFSTSYFGSGLIIQRAVEKEGKRNFKVVLLGFAASRSELNILEVRYIAEYRRKVGRDKMYNLSDGGYGGRDGPHSKKTIDKIKRTKALHPKVHKTDCQCASCKSKRGEKVKHKLDCLCPFCKVGRGEKSPLLGKKKRSYARENKG